MISPKKTEAFRELETITVLATALLVLNLFLCRDIFVYASFVLLLIGLFVKPVARGISRVWLIFADRLGVFNSKVILTILFLFFLTPLAFMYRLFSKKQFQLKRPNNTRSMYSERNHLYTSSDFEKMW